MQLTISRCQNLVMLPFFFLSFFSVQMFVQMESKWLQEPSPNRHSFPFASTRLFPGVCILSEGSPPSLRVPQRCPLMHRLKYWLLCYSEHLKTQTAWWEIVFTQIREIKLWTVQVSSNQFQLVHIQFQPQASEEKMWFWQQELLVGV